MVWLPSCNFFGCRFVKLIRLSRKWFIWQGLLYTAVMQKSNVFASHLSTSNLETLAVEMSRTYSEENILLGYSHLTSCRIWKCSVERSAFCRITVLIIMVLI